MCENGAMLTSLSDSCPKKQKEIFKSAYILCLDIYINVARQTLLSLHKEMHLCTHI